MLFKVEGVLIVTLSKFGQKKLLKEITLSEQFLYFIILFHTRVGTGASDWQVNAVPLTHIPVLATKV